MCDSKTRENTGGPAKDEKTVVFENKSLWLCLPNISDKSVLIELSLEHFKKFDLTNVVHICIDLIFQTSLVWLC